MARTLATVTMNRQRSGIYRVGSSVWSIIVSAAIAVCAFVLDPEDLDVLEFMLRSAATIVVVVVGVDLAVRAAELVIRRIWAKDAAAPHANLPQREGATSTAETEADDRRLAGRTILPISARPTTPSPLTADAARQSAKAA